MNRWPSPSLGDSWWGQWQVSAARKYFVCGMFTTVLTTLFETLTMARERTQTTGWLPSSTQLFATVLVASVLAVGLSTAATNKQLDEFASLHQPTAIIAVGRLLQCQQVEEPTVQQLQATAAAVSAGQAINWSLQRRTAVGLVEEGCSMHLPSARSNMLPGKATWQPGPVQQQHLHVSGVDSLDCLMQSSMPADSRTPYIWLLRSSGEGQYCPKDAWLPAACHHTRYPQATPLISSRDTPSLQAEPRVST